jgi:hypothetical protein
VLGSRELLRLGAALGTLLLAALCLASEYIDLEPEILDGEADLGVEPAPGRHVEAELAPCLKFEFQRQPVNAVELFAARQRRQRGVNSSPFFATTSASVAPPNSSS